MRKQGTVARWDEARGFGFIRSPASSADIFFHARDFRTAGGQRPREGLAVVFEEIHVGGKGPRAMAVELTGASVSSPQAIRTTPRRHGSDADRPAPRPPERARQRHDRRHHGAPRGSGAVVILPLMLAYAGTLVWSVWAGKLPFWVLPASAVLNLVAFFAYWTDKYAATTGQWRTSESALHLWSLAGGWGGAWFAQHVLRHKSSKASFIDTWRGTVFVHCGGLAAWLWWTTKHPEMGRFLFF